MAGAQEWLLYDVTDPLRPRVVCRMQNTDVHIVTGTSFVYLVPRPSGTTDVVLHALGSNNESVAATFQANIYAAYPGGFGGVAFSPGLDRLAYTADGGTDANGSGITDVWVASTSVRTKVYSYTVPGRDTFGRPGFPAPILSFSPDGLYLAAGWVIGTPTPRVFHLPDLANVSPAWPSDFRTAMWGRTGHTLYVLGNNAVAEWTPGGQLQTIPATPGWVWEPNLSPNGLQVAFTSITSSRDVRTYVYDLAAKSSRQLVD